MQKQTITLNQKIDSPSKEESFLIFDIQEDFEFKAWQFVMITVNFNWTEITRPYSIVSTPSETKQNKQISFYVKKASENWASYYLTQVIGPWDQVDIKWPVWHYVDNGNNKNYLFISTGCWVAPNLSLYKNIVYENWNYDKVVSMFSEKTSNNINRIIPETFSIYDKNIKNLFFLTREQKENYYYWRITNYLTQNLEFFDNKKITVFLCGSPEMVDDIKPKLINYWISEENILSEKY